MANSNAFSAVPELDVEENLFFALTYGPYEQNEGILDSLEEVDVKMFNHRTLLHVGVSLGKVDWVEELLARGADPNLEDDNHLTAISSAEEMLGRFPEDSDHRQVWRLVRMVHRRDQAMRRRLQTSSVSSAASSTPPVLQSDHSSTIATLSSSMDALKEEMMSLAEGLRSSLEELKEQLCGWEGLKGRLDAVVTSSLEDLTSINRRLPDETPLRAIGTTSETPLPPSNMADERRECVDGMMGRTVVVFGGERGVRFVRRLYERLFDEDVTKCLLQFLRRESRFVAKVDCGSNDIERMKETVVNLDGEECSGSGCISFPEFSTNTVYLGVKLDNYLRERAVAGLFACALAQMSFHIAFKNGGKPYEGGDDVHETEMKRALEEAVEDNRKRGDGLHEGIRGVLDYETQTARESELAAYVPMFITFYGSNYGTSVLQEQVPLLLHYFKEHVVSTLLAKARILSPVAPVRYSATPLPPSNMADERKECVDGMMKRTEVVFGGEEGVRFVRRLYERFFDEDVVTECLVQCLRGESRFVVKLDCDSFTIGRMREKFVDSNGIERSGSDLNVLNDMSNNTVYFGAKVNRNRSEELVAGSFASALARMSFRLCFKNGGKPYEDGDNVREKEFKRALEEAEEEKRKRGDGLHSWIRSALNRSTQTMRECYLAACVPQIITYYGSNYGTSVLQEQVPLLLHYFKQHVVLTLFDQAVEPLMQQRSDGPSGENQSEPLQLQQRSYGRSGGIRSLRRKIQNFFQKTLLIILFVVFLFLWVLFFGFIVIFSVYDHLWSY